MDEAWALIWSLGLGSSLIESSNHIVSNSRYRWLHKWGWVLITYSGMIIGPLSSGIAWLWLTADTQRADRFLTALTRDPPGKNLFSCVQSLSFQENQEEVNKTEQSFYENWKPRRSKKNKTTTTTRNWKKSFFKTPKPLNQNLLLVTRQDRTSEWVWKLRHSTSASAGATVPAQASAKRSWAVAGWSTKVMVGWLRVVKGG